MSSANDTLIRIMAKLKMVESKKTKIEATSDGTAQSVPCRTKSHKEMIQTETRRKKLIVANLSERLGR